ncbi:MAG: hypothetical protein QGF19_05530, partial [Paracoccaceae bacterium]|nr:hypothetical protein [Paracoccaceae bacterium]
VAALLFFNLGVEVGQIVFVIPVMLLVFAAKKFNGSVYNYYKNMGYKFIFYIIGFVACFWFVERSMQFSI